MNPECLSSYCKSDTALLSVNLPVNKRHAFIVRVAEKQILRGTIEKLQAMQQALHANGESDKEKKRKNSVVSREGLKKAKRW
jgi:hypothetical protein